MLKTISVFFLFLLFSYADAFSQNIVGQKPERNVPVIVSTAFNEKFPSSDPIWFSNYQGRYNQKLVYEGRFIFDNRYSSAIYDRDGILLAFATKIENKEIPKQALKYMSENFPTFPILDSILVTSKNNDVTYELGIMIDDEYIIKVFSDKGEFIKSTRA